MGRILAVLGGHDCRVTYPNGDRVEFAVTLFLCTDFAGELVPDGIETASAAWFAPGDMPQLTFAIPDEALSRERPAAFFRWQDDWLSLLR